MEKIRTVAQNGNDNILPTSPLKHSSPPPVGNLDPQSSEISSEARNMEKDVHSGEGFIEIYDMPDCFSRFNKNNPP